MPMPNKWLVALITRLLRPLVANKVASLGMILGVKVTNNQSFHKILQEPITM
jgi:hypothetical protein